MWLSLLTFFLSAVPKILTSLGIGVISYVAFTTVANGIVGQVQGMWSGLPAAILQIASLGGIPQALGLICGAFLSRAALLAGKSMGFLS